MVKQNEAKIAQYDLSFSEIPTRSNIFVKASESKLLAVKQKFIDDGFPADAAEKYL